MSEHDEGSGATLPTNRELAAEIKKLSDRLGIETHTTGLNKQQLLDVLEQVRRNAQAPLTEPHPPVTGTVRAEPSGPESSARAAVDAPSAPKALDRSPLEPELEAELDLLAEQDWSLAQRLGDLLQGAGPRPDGALAPAETEAFQAFLRASARLIELRGQRVIAAALRARADELTGMPEEPRALRGYEVAKGRSVTTRRGLRSSGDPIVGSDFRDGSEGLERAEALVRAGVLVRS